MSILSIYREVFYDGEWFTLPNLRERYVRYLIGAITVPFFTQPNFIRRALWASPPIRFFSSNTYSPPPPSHTYFNVLLVCRFASFNRHRACFLGRSPQKGKVGGGSEEGDDVWNVDTSIFLDRKTTRYKLFCERCFEEESESDEDEEEEVNPSLPTPPRHQSDIRHSSKSQNNNTHPPKTSSNQNPNNNNSLIRQPPLPYSTSYTPTKFNSQQKSATLITNDSSVVPPLSTLLSRVDRKLKAKAYIHQFEGYGVGINEFYDAFHCVEQVLGNYENLGDIYI